MWPAKIQGPFPLFQPRFQKHGGKYFHLNAKWRRSEAQIKRCTNGSCPGKLHWRCALLIAPFAHRRLFAWESSNYVARLLPRLLKLAFGLLLSHVFGEKFAGLVLLQGSRGGGREREKTPTGLAFICTGAARWLVTRSKPTLNIHLPSESLQTVLPSNALARTPRGR